MGLLARLNTLGPKETWPALHNAADERYWDGLELATCRQARHLGAIYLLGYVAEIVLKVAFFRVLGWPSKQSVDLKALKTHASWGRSNLHDVEELAKVLIAERANRKKAFNPVFAAQLQLHAKCLSTNWRETLRYNHSSASYAELAEVFQSVEWLRLNFDLL